MKTVMTEETRRSSESPPPSLPYDITLNILARISRIHHPTLSLVSKSFRSLLASRELDATRTLIGKTENYIYICLKFREDYEPRWLIRAPTPKQQKLITLPWFPNEHPTLRPRHPESPTVVSIGSLIYLIGGFVHVHGEKSRSVFLLDCRSHQWRTLPDMRTPRGRSVAGLIDGKIYVLGGCSVGENWGEIYDPKTQNWELLSPTTLRPHISIQKNLETDILGTFGCTNFCFVAEEKILCTSLHFTGNSLNWCDAEENTEWRELKGLNGLPDSPDFISVANPSGGRRLTVWWVSYQKERDGVLVSKINIWCAEISFERRSREELYGIVEWSKILYTLDRSDTGGLISLLCSATVMH